MWTFEYLLIFKKFEFKFLQKIQRSTIFEMKTEVLFVAALIGVKEK